MKTGKLIGAFFVVMLFVLAPVSATIESSVDKTQAYVPNTYEPNPYITENVTIANYKNTSTSALTYENDGGTDETLPGTAQKIYLDPTQIVSPLGLQKPIADGSVNGTDWLNVSKWTNASGSTQSTPQISVVTQNGVKKLRLSIAGNASGFSTARFGLDLTDYTIDINKTYLILGIEVIDGQDVENATYSYISIVAGSDDSTWNAGRKFYMGYPEREDESICSLIAGEKCIVQVPISDGLFQSSDVTTLKSIWFYLRDNLLDSADSISVYVYILGVDTKKHSFGKLADVSVFEMPPSDGGVMLLDTFKSSFKWEKVSSFGPVEFKMSASDLTNKSTIVKYEELSDTQKADYTASYAVREMFTLNFTLPEVVDLTYDSNGVLKDVPNVNTQQYGYASLTVGTADPVQKTSTYTGARKGDTVILVSSMVAGTAYAMYYELLLTQAQWEDISEEVAPLVGGTRDDSIVAWLIISILSLIGGNKYIKHRRTQGNE